MNCTALYVDVENLLDEAKDAIEATMEQWPKEFPPPDALRLYVRADQVELWRIWASYTLPSLDTTVKGVQHYTTSGSKNSADIALALDMLADLMKGRVSHAAVLSDDSDFVTLFAKITIETLRMENGHHPFIWFLTDRDGPKSPVISKFLPPHYIRTIKFTKKAPLSKKTASASSTVRLTPKKAPVIPLDSPSQAKQIAKMIVEQMPVGLFKSTDCVKLIKQFFPKHPLVALESAKFGIQFNKTILPELERYGVRIPNRNKKPRRYELTDEVKQKAGQVT